MNKADKKQVAAKRNERRRLKYSQDPEYRTRLIKSTREGYRKKHGTLEKPSSCLVNLEDLGAFGTTRKVTVAGVERRRLTFTTGELANALRRRVEILYRWMRNDMLPVPVHTSSELQNQHGQVYSYQEVRAIVQVLGEHQEQTPYYRQDHVETRKRLYRKVHATRYPVPKKQGAKS